MIDTVMLIYRHWTIMAYSEKLSDIIALEESEVHYTNISHYNSLYYERKSRAFTEVLRN